jgi:hypothetical protein
MVMRWTVWIWAVGCAVWGVDGLLSVATSNWPQAKMAFLLALLFAGAFAFFRNQRPRA